MRGRLRSTLISASIAASSPAGASTVSRSASRPASPGSTWCCRPPHLQALRQIARQVQQRATVYDAWGFAAQSARGLGLSVLFAGESGTGKTMAAEVLAENSGSTCTASISRSVVSKYIGETEKNLARVFDAAEDGGAILLFDEADALFGKRSEVKDSHDRYANIEVSYLLQRMEAYRGLAILTTNLKTALDRGLSAAAAVRRATFRSRPGAARRSGVAHFRARPAARSRSPQARAAQRRRRQHPQHRAERRLPCGRIGQALACPICLLPPGARQRSGTGHFQMRRLADGRKKNRPSRRACDSRRVSGSRPGGIRARARNRAEPSPAGTQIGRSLANRSNADRIEAKSRAVPRSLKPRRKRALGCACDRQEVEILNALASARSASGEERQHG